MFKVVYARNNNLQNLQILLTSQIFALSSHDDQIYENFGAVAFKRSFFFKKRLASRNNCSYKI